MKRGHFKHGSISAPDLQPLLNTNAKAKQKKKFSVVSDNEHDFQKKGSTSECTTSTSHTYREFPSDGLHEAPRHTAKQSHSSTHFHPLLRDNRKAAQMKQRSIPTPMQERVKRLVRTLGARHNCKTAQDQQSECRKMPAYTISGG